MRAACENARSPNFVLSRGSVKSVDDDDPRPERVRPAPTWNRRRNCHLERMDKVL